MPNSSCCAGEDVAVDVARIESVTVDVCFNALLFPDVRKGAVVRRALAVERCHKSKSSRALQNECEIGEHVSVALAHPRSGRNSTTLFSKSGVYKDGSLPATEEGGTKSALCEMTRKTQR